MIENLKTLEERRKKSEAPVGFRSDSATVVLRYMTVRVMIYCSFLVCAKKIDGGEVNNTNPQITGITQFIFVTNTIKKCSLHFFLEDKTTFLPATCPQC